MTGRSAGPSLRLALAIIAIGLAVGIPSAVKVIVPFGRDLVTAPAFATPGTAHLHLGTGRYSVFEHTGTTSQRSGFSVGEQGPVSLESGAVIVTDDAGQPLAVRQASGAETITRGSRVYTAAAEFDVERSGVYDVHVAETRGGQVIVARSLTDTFGAVAGWLVAGALAALALCLGFVLLIVGSIRRGRTQTPAAVTAGATGWVATAAPPGWYADPEGRPGLRYWDGAQWTDHRT